VFDGKAFQDFRHGYAGTIYKGQGRTLDQTYLYHSEHWRSAASYVALTRHRDKTELFVAQNTAADVNALSRQMARIDDRRAASRFYYEDERGLVRPLSPRELAARFNETSHQRPSGQPPSSADSPAAAPVQADKGRGNSDSMPGMEMKDSRQERLARLRGSEQPVSDRLNQAYTPGVGRTRTR
jgi:hypothetical protein